MKKLIALLLAALLLAGCSQKNAAGSTNPTGGETPSLSVTVANRDDLFSDRDYQTD